MPRKKRFIANRIPHAEVGTTKKAHRFDALDWIAAFFVIATPLYIAYRLFSN